MSEAIACPECSTTDWIVVTLERNSRTELLDLHDGEWVRHDKDEEVIETTVEAIYCENDHNAVNDVATAVNAAWMDADYRG